MPKDISTKSTKTEILEAYNELLARVQGQKPVDPKSEKTKSEERKVVEASSALSSEKIMKALGDVKLQIAQSLDTLSDRLLAEHRKFSDLQRSVEIESKYLDEVYEIKLNADGLAALILAQQEKKNAFEREMQEKRDALDEEMNQKRAQWKQEQENYELQKKERDAQLKKERQREEDDYSYNLQLKRKKENDAYDVKRAEREKELADREATLATRENEIADLVAKVNAFPKQLEKAVQEAEATTRERIEMAHKHAETVRSKEAEGEKKLTEHIIASLERKVKEQDEAIRQLTQKADAAIKQVQALAIKAIESGAPQRLAASAPEKSGDSSKN